MATLLQFVEVRSMRAADLIANISRARDTDSSGDGNDSTNAERDVEFGDSDSASDYDQANDIIGSNNSDYRECNTVEDDRDTRR
ncbi:hypothetical protein PF005_g8010 [Phytophthora fragariae]|uniref:Uncharacterized protein n=1 Tax=Phytophthora fragariae TaxID=53985 RepID=A0A6A4AG66_9STRA|nr:hypothetical protein PF011_g6999 [Phytophthora fragariae]KAE9219097.1 hypothetical protein PF005_g8010 [Phytophthora fragariae]KAE9254442.1 hypothetical protein PF002_g2851 [Phytophthora fragariae]